MTCREKLQLEHPNYIKEIYCGGCHGCPSDYGYLPNLHADCPYHVTAAKCRKCWDREIPEKTIGTFEHNGKPIGKVVEATVTLDGLEFKIETINDTTEIDKENNMATTKKTKAELMEELENVKNAKEELEKELKNLDKYKQYEDMAGEVHAIYVSFVHAGFSEEQAYDLLKTMIQNAGNITFNTSVTPSYRSRK